MKKSLLLLLGTLLVVSALPYSAFAKQSKTLIPIVDAPDYAILFNLGPAKALGINIPGPLLTAADHVYRETPRLTRSGQ